MIFLGRQKSEVVIFLGIKYEPLSDRLPSLSVAPELGEPPFNAGFNQFTFD